MFPFAMLLAAGAVALLRWQVPRVFRREEAP